LLDDLKVVQILEKNRNDTELGETFGFVFSSDEDRDLQVFYSRLAGLEEGVEDGASTEERCVRLSRRCEEGGWKYMYPVAPVRSKRVDDISGRGLRGGC
jgi:hypothetical protein